MDGLPPLNLSAPSNATATSGLDSSGSIFHASGDGDWNVNMAPGLNMQGGGLSPWLIAAAVAAGLFFFMKKG